MTAKRTTAEHLDIERLHRERLHRLQQRLIDLNIGGLLLFDMKNIRYLTGFTGSEGVCVVLQKELVLLVDGRYLTQAREQVRNTNVELYRDKLSGIAGIVSGHALADVGFETSALTYDIYLHLKKQLKNSRLKPVDGEVQNLRKVKDKTELALMGKAVDISHQALMAIRGMIKPSVMERDIAIDLDYKMRALGAEDISFPTIVASGPRAALPHAQPGFRRIEMGDTVIIDYGAVVDGYHSDETCTFIVGQADDELRGLYDIVKEAHDRAIDGVRAGVYCREIDRIARSHIEAKGYGDYFSHGTGHGVGLDVHESPRLGLTSADVLEKGMVVTVEPGIYIPGRRGIRIEDMVVVEDDGCQVVTKTSKLFDIVH
ncbi:MAG: Aminopeptidase YpdF [Syntrophus sp. SKADARSKE-3]|nr:Aminopeptidase YpdF [Syntrophus sp. SKADARSKE-3]